MITSYTPETWEDLQDAVARILRECGLSSQVEKTLETARGTVEIDVYSVESVNGRKFIVLCECKHWKSRVPKQVVHAFRSVVADSGANIGYIISSGGFQSGSFDAADLTNIRLLTWLEFQREFEKTWLRVFMRPLLYDRLHVLMSHTAPGGPSISDSITNTQKERLNELVYRYSAFGWLMTNLYLTMEEVAELQKEILPLSKRPILHVWTG